MADQNPARSERPSGVDRPGIVSDPNSKRYGSACAKHERDPFNVMRCWKCGATMRAPASRGGGRR